MLDEWLIKRSFRELGLIFLALFLLGFYASYEIAKAVYEKSAQEQIAQIASLNQNIGALKKFISQQTKQEQSQKHLALSIAELKAKLNELSLKIAPLKADTSSAMQILLTNAKNLNINILSISPLSQDEQQSQSGLKVEILSEFDPLMRFLQNVEKELFVKELEISKQDGKLKASFLILLIKG